jgi:glycosyltransferase involved in cell wall biosynthesis
MSKRIRIAWITTGLAAKEGDHVGIASIHDLAKYLSESADVELSIFALYHPVSQEPLRFSNSWVYCGKVKGEYFSDTGKIQKLKSFKRIISLFRNEHNKKPFDIIHSIWAGESGYTAAYLAKKYNIPLIVNICGGELADLPEINYGSRTKPVQKYFVSKALNTADIIVSSSDFISEKVKHYYGSKIYSKVRKLPFGVDGTLFKPSVENEQGQTYPDNPVLLNISSAFPVKAHNDLFAAINIVKQKYPGVMLQCCGYDEKNILKDLAAQAGLTGNVKIIGFVDHSGLPHLMHNSDVYVLSSLYESQNVSLIEASFTGLPVVSTDVGIAKELTPLISQPGDPLSLAQNIFKAIESPNMNYPGIREKFSLNTCSEKFIYLYRSLL